MNVPRKSAAERITSAEFPAEMPKLRAAWDRSDLEGWGRKMDQWWFDFRGALQRQHSIVEDGLTSERQALDAEAAAIRQLVAELQQRLEVLEAPPEDDEADRLEDLTREFEAHVNDTTAHGVTPSEAVELPQFSIQPNTIEGTVDVPAGRHLVTTGAIVIPAGATLRVSGRFINI